VWGGACAWGLLRSLALLQPAPDRALPARPPRPPPRPPPRSPQGNQGGFLREWLQSHLDAAKSIGKPLLVRARARGPPMRACPADGSEPQPALASPQPAGPAARPQSGGPTAPAADPCCRPSPPPRRTPQFEEFGKRLENDNPNDVAELRDPVFKSTYEAIEAAVEANEPLLGSMYWKWAFPIGFSIYTGAGKGAAVGSRARRLGHAGALAALLPPPAAAATAHGCAAAAPCPSAQPRPRPCPPPLPQAPTAWPPLTLP
jgi:hypothetical protein